MPVASSVDCESRPDSKASSVMPMPEWAARTWVPLPTIFQVIVAIQAHRMPLETWPIVFRLMDAFNTFDHQHVLEWARREMGGGAGNSPSPIVR